MRNKIKLSLLILLGFLVLIADAAGAIDPNAPDPQTGRLNPFAKFQIQAVPTIQRIDPTTRPAYNAQPQMIDKPPMFIETMVIKFLDAQNLKTAIEPMLSPVGSIAVDKNSNSIIICDANEPLQRIVSEIKKVDITPQLLQIEVVIVDVQLDDDTEVGVNWDFLSNENHTVTFRQNFTQRLASTPDTSENIQNATAFNTVGTGSDLSIISGTIRNVVHLLQEKKKVSILASPTVLVVSGKTASVETVEEIPYQEQTDSALGGGFASTQFKLVGVKLNVSATLTDDNSILLTVEPEQNTNTGTFGINNIPIIDTRKAKTNLLLKDSDVVIMGGLRRKETSKVRDQIPILGSIPIIGILFGRDKIQTLNSELVVFLSPHIYKDRCPSPEKMAKFNYVNSLPGVPIYDTNAPLRE